MDPDAMRAPRYSPKFTRPDLPRGGSGSFGLVRCAHCDRKQRDGADCEGFLCDEHWRRVPDSLRASFRNAVKAWSRYRHHGAQAGTRLAAVDRVAALMGECRRAAAQPKDLFDTLGAA